VSRPRHPADPPLKQYWYVEQIDSSDPRVRINCDHRHRNRNSAASCAVRTLRARLLNVLDRNGNVVGSIPNTAGFSLKFEAEPKPREEVY
jgi:hypothetical protein